MDTQDQPNPGKHVESYATGDSHTESPPKPVSHVMPEDPRAYPLIQRLQSEVSQLTSQLSTLKAQTKEVLKAGDEMASSITWGEFIRQSKASEAWQALRQSGVEEARHEAIINEIDSFQPPIKDQQNNKI